ncbi:MAG: LysM domain-containing protein [Lachnospiraceae bacterium]
MSYYDSMPMQAKSEKGPCRGMIYKVKPGDTLYSIGKKFHVSVTRLLLNNPYVEVYNLRIGQELCIPYPINCPCDGPQPR